MKKKVILSSVLAIALSASIAVGGTFALFTSESKVNVAITSGKVEVVATVSDLATYSAVAAAGGELVDENGATYNYAATTTGTFTNGGTATITNGNTLTLDRVTPGDKVEFNINVANNSNVAVKYRTSIVRVADDGLYSGLTVKIGESVTSGITAWQNLAAPAGGSATIVDLACSVELPIDKGNTYQNKSCKIAFTVEAVQSNAATSDDTVIVNPENVQAYLDGEYGSIDGKTVVLEPGNYAQLELGRATKYAGSNTQYYIGGISEGNEKTFDEFYAIKNNGQWSASAYYVRNMSNVTFKAAEGATVTVAGLVASSGHYYDNVYDYVLDKAYTSGSAYYLAQKFSNITFEGISFTSNVDIRSSLEETVIDGVSFKNCNFTSGGTASSNGQALRYYNENNNGNVRNLTVDSCTFNNCYQGVYTQKINGITVKNSSFDTTGHNAIAVQSDSEAVNHKAVVITGNTFANIGNRIIRFGDVGADTQITIRNNTATNSGDSAGEVIRAQNLAEGITYSISGNNWGAGKTVGNTQFQDA